MNVTDANLSNKPKWLKEYDAKVRGRGMVGTNRRQRLEKGHGGTEWLPAYMG